MFRQAGVSLWPQVIGSSVSSTSFNYWLVGLRTPQVRSNKQGWVLWNHGKGFGSSCHEFWCKFSAAFQTQGALTFNQDLHRTCLWTNSPERVPKTPGDEMWSQGSLFSSNFWCQHQSQEWAKALVLGHREQETRQPLQFPWETENIFPTLWMRKLKQREKCPRFFKEVKSQELWG